MITGNGTPSQYSISMSQVHRQELLQLHLQEHALGFGKRFLDAYREALRRLKRDPQVFGEALYRLPLANLDVRHAVVDRLVIDYGVHEETKIVFIRRFRALSLGPS
jgi:hypothetical protein